MSTACPHLQAASLKEPTYSQTVYREECTLCFDTQDSKEGIDVCLTCFNGSCPRAHAALHFSKKRHALAVNIKRTKKQRTEQEPPLKKLAIRQEPAEAELYDWTTSIKCYECARTLAPDEAEKVGDSLSCS